MERLQEILRIINGSPAPADTYKVFKPEILRLLQTLGADLSGDYIKAGRPYAHTKNVKIAARIHDGTPHQPPMTPEAAIAQAWGSFFAGAHKSR